MTQWRDEWRAAHHIERIGFTYYLPQYRALTDAGVACRSLLFPGYIFVLLADGWEAISGLRGVSRVLTTDERPWLIPAAVIDEIKSREDPTGLVREFRKFQPGDRVSIKNCAGMWSGHAGTYVGDSALIQHSLVEFLIFGRTVRASVQDKFVEPRA